MRRRWTAKLGNRLGLGLESFVETGEGLGMEREGEKVILVIWIASALRGRESGFSQKN